MITPTKRFFRLLAPHSRAVTHLYTFAILSGIVALTLPLGIQAIINLIQGGEISAAWVLLIIVVLFGYSFNGMMQIFQLRITENLQKDIFTKSAFEFTFRIPRIKMSALHNQYAPELMNRFFDTISIQKGISKVLIEFSTSALQIIFGLLLLSFYHPFFIIFSVILIIISLIIGVYLFQRGLKSSLTESKHKYKVAFWLEELARTNTTFRLTSNSMLPLRRTDELVDAYLHAREIHFRILLRQYYLFIAFKILVAAAFLFLGGILVFNQQMNIGQFVAAEIIVLLLISSSEKLLLTLEVVYDLLTAIEKVGQVTDMELEEDSGIEMDITRNNGVAVTVKGVSFKYPDAQEYIIQNCNLEIAAGEKVCLTGDHGSGKSTLLSLMTAFYEPDQGTIAYDGLPIKNYNISLLRNQIAECISEDSIFAGTLLENLTLGKQIDTERVIEVCQMLGLSDFLIESQAGLNTMLGPIGRKLSRSLTKKLILARSILKKPKLLIMDDFFSDLDNAEKEHLLECILSPSHPWTLIVNTSDTDMIKKFDRVIYMSKGKVVSD
jgi:ABC-type bacteriocin/lantibiotic exporter with double-glycine peptidase domain